MAAAPVAAEDDLSCPICLKLFVDIHIPINLPLCGHVCCEVCLKKMVEGKCQQTCPECRKVINIPDVGGISSFTTNFRLRNLAENHQKVGTNICQRQVSPKKAGVPLCPDHEDEKMHFYCVTCNSLACQACLILKHNGTGHNIEGVKEIYKKQKLEMKSASTKANSTITEIKSVLSDLKTAKNQRIKFYQNVEKEIEQCKKSHMNALLTESQELTTQVEKARQMQSEGFKNKSTTVQKQIHSAQESYRATISATKNLPDYEYITQHAILVSKMKDIQILKSTTLFDVGKMKQDVKKFVPSSSHTILGHIVSVSPGKARKIEKIQTLDGFSNAYRLDCSSGGLLAVADYDRKKIVICYKVHGEYSKTLDLNLAPENEYNPNGIAICPDGRLMVARFTCIEVYSPDGNHQNDIKIKGSRSEVKVGRIQVTSDDRILIGDYEGSLVVEISQVGEVIRKIKTRIQPSHMILIHDTHIAISDFAAGKVIVIDIDSWQETLSIDIKGVDGICYDERTECLLTARNVLSGSKPGSIRINTGVIEQYSYSTGKLIACLQQGLYHRMVLTSDGHLIVANYKTVEIYDIH